MKRLIALRSLCFELLTYPAHNNLEVRMKIQKRRSLNSGRPRHSTQTGRKAHPNSYQYVPGDVSTGEKRLGSEADHSAPSTAEVKNGRSNPFAHTHVLMV